MRIRKREQVYIGSWGTGIGVSGTVSGPEIAVAGAEEPNLVSYCKIVSLLSLESKFGMTPGIGERRGEFLVMEEIIKASIARSTQPHRRSDRRKHRSLTDPTNRFEFELVFACFLNESTILP